MYCQVSTQNLHFKNWVFEIGTFTEAYRRACSKGMLRGKFRAAAEGGSAGSPPTPTLQ